MQFNPVENEYKEHKEKLSKVRMDHKRILADKKKKVILKIIFNAENCQGAGSFVVQWLCNFLV